MSTLESIVLPLPESQSLAAAGIVLDTALVWVEFQTGWAYELMTRHDSLSVVTVDIIGAPVLSEIMDAIRAKYPDAEFEFVEEGIQLWSPPQVNVVALGLGPTDLLAAYNLLMEVSRDKQWTAGLWRILRPLRVIRDTQRSQVLLSHKRTNGTPCMVREVPHRKLGLGVRR